VAQRRPFVPLTGAPVLARIPLLPVADSGMDASPLDGVLVEGMCFASRQAGEAARRDPRIDGDRLAVTVRAYDRRARLRPTPRGVFAGVQIARIAGQRVELRLGSNHRARSVPSAGWMAAMADHALTLPGVLQRLTFTTSNLVRRRGRRIEHEQQARPGGDAPHRVTMRATDATTLILGVCETGAAYATIVSTVCREWPSVPEPLICSTLVSLVKSSLTN
jgi:class I lanthipeptide synthase